MARGDAADVGLLLVVVVVVVVVMMVSVVWASPQMQVDSLSRGRSQPFYRVLVDMRDRTGRLQPYVAEECMVRVPLDEGSTIQHDDIGRYFCRRVGPADAAVAAALPYTVDFVANAELRRRFPDDCPFA
jgi:hemimethylated DNA binding protein